MSYDYDQAFSRNIGILTEQEQNALRQSTVAVAGAGGVGGIHLATLARMGVGNFHVADEDVFEIVNINRQYGASVETFGENKAETVAAIVKSINPQAKVTVFKEFVNAQNIDSFLQGVDVALDGIDFFQIDARRLYFMTAWEKKIPVVTSGPLGFGAMLLNFSPTGMNFDEYFGINDSMGYEEKIAAFAVGLTPALLHLKYLNLGKVDLKAGKGPALASACALCAGLASTEAVNWILKRTPPLSAPYYFQFDPYLKRYKKGYLWFGGKNPIQKLKQKILLRRVKRAAKI